MEHLQFAGVPVQGIHKASVASCSCLPGGSITSIEKRAGLTLFSFSENLLILIEALVPFSILNF